MAPKKYMFLILNYIRGWCKVTAPELCKSIDSFLLNKVGNLGISE
jgi:hypothetical protein